MAPAPGESRRGRRRLLVVLAGGLAAAVVTAVVVLGGGGGDVVDTELAASDDELTAAPERDTEGDEAAQREAERIAEAQAGRLAELEEERAAAEEAAEQAAAEEAAAEEEAAEQAAAEAAAEEERLAEQEAEEQAQAAEAEQRSLTEAQQRLAELGYYVGAADGQAGQQTTAAVMAFQAVNGLSVDGALGPQTWEALDAPRNQPSLRGGSANRIEVDMDLQVLHLVQGNERVTTMKVSTGRGGTFESESGEQLRAETPVGTFTIDRRIQGEHQSSYGIGGMWDPVYFHGPWAIHGSPNVPAGPASAGCVRVSMADGSWLFDRAPSGTEVVLYGGTHVFTP
jgi:peptidoglycan hydrolase-like protein with peptidoglycan-binding domain